VCVFNLKKNRRISLWKSIDEKEKIADMRVAAGAGKFFSCSEFGLFRIRWGHGTHTGIAVLNEVSHITSFSSARGVLQEKMPLSRKGGLTMYYR